MASDCSVCFSYSNGAISDQPDRWRVIRIIQWHPVVLAVLEPFDFVKSPLVSRLPFKAVVFTWQGCTIEIS